MSMQVDRFLSDSGGNFTESAPRPPVPGEENELQSNGGTSTKSSSSHKSQLSVKSHTSNKSSGRSDNNHHSPAATPRRSNLDKSNITASFHHDTIARKRMPKDDQDAPLGFEPEGSAASSPPFTENSTPPYLKWAENIEALLEDREGVRLFKQFLDQEYSSNPLDFWFACKGLQVGVQADDADKIKSLVKLIYKRYIRSDHLNLPADLKKSIMTKCKKETYEQGIFQDAKMLIQDRMSSETYPLFLKSDIYLQYVQLGGESPKTISNTSSGSNSARPLSGPLPTVHEGEELKQEDFRNAANTSVVDACPPPPSSSSMAAANNTTILPLTPESFRLTLTMRANSEAPRQFAIPEGFPKYSKHNHGMGMLQRGRGPVHQEHMSYAPVSQWDSEVQSLSSDALTESDNMSLTDSSVDGREVRRGSSRWKQKQRRMKQNAIQNRHTGLAQQIIPRTERALKDRNIAETDPEKFAALLIEKLEAVKAKLEEPERMRELLHNIEIQDTPPITSAQSNNNKSINMSQLNMTTNSSMLNSSAMAPPPPPRVPINNTINNASMNNSLSFLMTSMSGTEEENAQSILEDHVSRIWDESTGQTPVLTPGRHSPDRIRGGGGASQSLLHPPGYVKGKQQQAVRNQGQSGSGILGAVENEGVASSAANTSMSSSEYHKHIHHHHYHQHHVHNKDAGAVTNVNTSKPPRQTVPVSSASSQMPHNISAPLLTQVPSTSGSKDSKRPAPLSSGVSPSPSSKRIPDNNSNIDSGIYSVPDLRDPANNKVMTWMLENEKVSTGATQYSTDNSDKGSSHKRSHKSGSSVHKSKKQGGGGGGAGAYERSSSLDRSLPVQGSSQYHPPPHLMQLSALTVSSSQSQQFVQPSQPIVQDPSMPPLSPAKTTVQLEEVRRRLLSDHQAQGDNMQVQHQRAGGSAGAGMGKSKSYSMGMSSAGNNTPMKQQQQQQQQRISMQPPPLPPCSYHYQQQQQQQQQQHHNSYHIPSSTSMVLPSYDMSSSDEQYHSFNSNFSHSRSTSRRQMPPPLPPHSQQSMVNTSISSMPPPRTTTSTSSTSDSMVVGYYFCSEPIPYRTTLKSSQVTLAQFKELLTRKGNYRYFFKKASDEFDSGVVYEEVTRDQDILPVCDGKIIGKVDKVE